MRKFYSLIIAFSAILFSLDSYAQTMEFHVPDVTIKPGETKKVEVYLTNELTLTYFEYNIHLPEGLTFVGDNGNTVYGEGVSSTFLSAVMQTAGFLKHGGMVLNVVPGEHLFATFEVKASDDFEGGQIRFTDIIVDDYDQDDMTANVKVEKDSPVVGHQFVVENFEIVKGKTKIVEIYLETEDVLTYFEYNIYLPAGLSFVGDDGNTVFGEGVSSTFLSAVMQTGGFLKHGGMVLNVPAGRRLFATFEIKASEEFKKGDIKFTDIIVDDYDQDDMTVKVTGVNATSIDAIQTISDNAVIYNIAGQRVNANAKGLVIKNGKKFINK